MTKKGILLKEEVGFTPKVDVTKTTKKKTDNKIKKTTKK